MDPHALATRLHDILRDAQRIRLPGPGCTAGAAVESIDEVKGGLGDLLRDLGAHEPSRHAPRQPATAAAFPPGDGDGIRPVVQHRRRVRRTCPDRILARGSVDSATITARAAAEALFASSEPGTMA